MSLHLVMTGFDETVFHKNAPSDTVQRFLKFGEILDDIEPQSHLTYLVFTGEIQFQAFQKQNVSFIPVNYRGLQGRWNFYQKLMQLHQKMPIHVISTQSIFEDAWVSLLVGRKLGIPVVPQLHFDLFESHAIVDNAGRGIRGRIRYWLALKMLPYYARFRVSSLRNKADLLKGNYVKEEAISVFPIGITIEPQTRTFDASLEPRVIYVGRLVDQKNMYDWLVVAEKVHMQNPEVRFFILGDGVLFSELKAYAEAHKMQEYLTFTGNISYDQLADYYTHADVFLLTSHYEGLPRVIIEASLHELPTVASRIAGVEDIVIHGKTGMLYEPLNVAQAVEQVLEMLNNRQHAYKMGIEARKWVQQEYDPGKIRRMLIELLVDATRDKV